MNRHDLGFVVSRGLAVYFLLTTVQWGATFLNVLFNSESRDAGYLLVQGGTGGVFLALAILLWTKAEFFGGPGGVRAEIQTPNQQNLQRALLAVLGMWLVCTSIPGIIQYLTLRSLNLTGPSSMMFPVEWQSSVAKMVIGMLLIFFNSPGLFSKVERAISVADPSETQ